MLLKDTKKLLDPSTSHKKYWSIFETFSNKKKIRFISPIFQENQFFADFKQMDQIFISHFSKQCMVIRYIRKLP